VQATDAGVRSAARLLRRVHDATAGWKPPSDAVWAVEPPTSGEVVCHGDPGPWNMVWRKGRAVGLFDWDFCHPGPRHEDVAYALEYLAPFRDDEEAQRWLGFTRPPDRAGRLRAFCEEYGISSEGMVDSVVEVQRRTIDRVRTLAAAKVEPQATWVKEDFLTELAARVSWSDNHRHLFC
jgi:aminoglycoside phosphotransferase (APT) family kinase protein